MRVVTLTKQSIDGASLLPFKSNKTLLEYDILIWDASYLAEFYTSVQDTGGNRGSPISQDKFEQVIQGIQRRNDEMAHMLDLGKAILIYTPEPVTVYITAGSNAHPIDLLSYFRFVNIQTSSLEGEGINFRGEEPFTTFWEANRKQFTYKAQLNTSIGKPLFYVQGTSIVLGTYLQIANGHVIFIPRFGEKAHTSTDEESFINTAIKLVEELNRSKSTNKIELPSWSESYILPDEHEMQNGLQQLEVELDTLQQRINQLKSWIEDLKRRKLLFVGTGKQLEIEIRNVFQALGFTDLTETEALPNRDDLILPTTCAMRDAFCKNKLPVSPREDEKEEMNLFD